MWPEAHGADVDHAVSFGIEASGLSVEGDDLMPPAKRQGAFSVSRVAMNLGVVVGPAVAGLALGWGATFRESRPAGAVPPVFCIGNFGSIYSAVYITDFLHVPYEEWGALLALNAFIVATVQYALVRATRRRNRMILLAVAGALLETGVGGFGVRGTAVVARHPHRCHERRRDTPLAGGLGRAASATSA